VALPPETIELEADATRLAQVLSNLLNNAAKYTDPGGRIGLSAAWDNGWVTLRVRDTGIGIAQELLPRIFDLFIQADPAGTRGQGGLGIGLPLVRSLVALHGGTVEAHSDGPGQGSEFTVRLPARLQAVPVTPDPKVNQSVGGGPSLRVLICDDNRDAADSLAVLLGIWGYEVHQATDGATALALARDYQPDAVLLDIGLPGGLNGYEVARRLRQESNRAYLIALTGFGGPEDRRRSREAGFDHHLGKPVDPTDLQELLTCLLR
jgi:CheY-like chemotaxis protein